MTWVEAIQEHWPLLSAVAAAVTVAGGLVAKAIRAREKEDERIERVSLRVVERLLESDRFVAAVERVVEAAKVRTEEQLRALRERDDQQAGSIQRAHERIDRVNDDIKQVWAAVAAGGRA